MNVQQTYELLNTVTAEVLGESTVVNEDLSNVVDIGRAVLDNDSFDHYVHALVDHVGKMVFVSRVYRGWAPNIRRDAWEYGAALQKVHARMPEAVENESWELEDGTSYDPFIFHAPEVASRFFANVTTFEVENSITEKQFKSGMSNAAQAVGFLTMIEISITNSLTVKNDALTMRLINSMIGDTLYTDYNSGSVFSGASYNRAVNVYELFKEAFPDTSLTAETCLFDPDFMRFFALTVKIAAGRLKGMSTLFNIGGEEKFTPPDKLHFVVLSDFSARLGVYLYDGEGQFNNDELKLAKHETVPYWQAPGTAYAFDDISSINVKTGSGNTVTASGILAVMFDDEAVMIANTDRSVKTQENKKADFTNYFYKEYEGYFADLNENFLVFFVA